MERKIFLGADLSCSFEVKILKLIPFGDLGVVMSYGLWHFTGLYTTPLVVEDGQAARLELTT